MKIQQLVFLLACCLFSSTVIGQSQSSLDLALRHIEENQAAWGLDKADIEDLKISDHTFSKKGSIDHYYFLQRYEGVDVYNAVTSVHVNPAGKTLAARHNFIPQLASKVSNNKAKISEAEALRQVLANLEITAPNFNYTPINRAEGKTTFSKGAVSNVDIVVRPIYQVVNKAEVRLAWDVTMDPTKNADYWNIRVDAENGKVLNKTNFTVYCSFGKSDIDTHAKQCTDQNHAAPLIKTSTIENESVNEMMMGGSYNVFAEIVDGKLYVHESPVHGDRNLITDPADANASPFGWHDVDGVEGAEFEITRGNNVHAYLDINDDNSPDAESDVTGGADLLFDFPWTDLENPENSEEAAVTNLFFMNNFLHDFTYAYGFDESAGNFQANNYEENPNGGNDHVRAEAHDGRQIHYDSLVDDDEETDDEDHINNANFATPSDGVSPRMQMFVWNRTGGKLLNVLAPEGLEGKYTTSTANYGPGPLEDPINSAELVLAFDGDPQNPSFGCGEIINDITGKIAVVDRGGCFFQDKSQNAEDAGAIAIIICNFEDATINMGASPEAMGIFPTIPSVMMENKDCQLIKSVINSGQTVTVSLGADGAVGADFYDGDVDNGIIAHEFAHGISNRLVGGPNLAGCLGNDEQMGEGWSDFFTLVTTIKPGELGSDRAGIGTYVSRENPNGNGIRSNPYSTDMATDPETFRDVTAVGVDPDTDRPSVHAVGAIWNSMIWDMYWALVDEYGFNDDLVNGDGGNNIGVRLVMEGMKFTSCSPGFVDGRDGILAADEFLYDGANSCIIWKAFARRGLGENASQGSSDEHQDGVEDFNPPPGCIKEVKLAKRIASDDRFADVVDPGGSVPMELIVRNDKDEAATEVLLTEEIPAGATVSDITYGGQVMGDNIVWELGTMEVGQADTITYTVTVDLNRQATTYFIDGLENGTENWISLTDAGISENPFTIINSDELFGSYNGEKAYYIENPGTETRENLLLLEGLKVEGENSVVRFFQNYDTEIGADGILVQLSLDGTDTWREIPELIFKNEYPRPIQYGTFTLPFLSAYSGNSDGWIDTWIDLSSFQGQEVFLRFRFGSDDNTAGIGWAMDDFEFMKMVNYNPTATLTTAEEDLVERSLPAKGIKVKSTGIVAVDDVENPSLGFNIYPNPASETVKLAINNISARDAKLSVFNYGGQLIEERVINLSAGAQLEEVNVRNYPTGFYFFRLTTDRGVGTEKIMIGK